jgi:ribosomal protein S18 acetylase RimI-like enzyme
MAASDNLSPVQFKYTVPSSMAQMAAISAYKGDEYVGGLSWRHRPDGHGGFDRDHGVVVSIGVEPEHRHQGIATGMWNEAKGMGVPMKHSSDLSSDGRSWAKTVH